MDRDSSPGSGASYPQDDTNLTLSSQNSTETDLSVLSTPMTTQQGDSPLPSATHSRAPSHAMKRFEPSSTAAAAAAEESSNSPAVLRSKTMSISNPIPVNPPTPHHARAQSSVPTPAPRDKDLTKSVQVLVPKPTQDSNFFSTLASQERLVLELKEELRKAEEHLSKLKKQWLSQEAMKRKNETRLMHKMRPLAASLANAPLRKDDADGSSAWMYQEMERRKALLGNTKPTQRRVFNGSRQLKSLSLLSPEKGLLDGYPLSAPPEDLPPGVRFSTPPARSFTTPDLAEQVAEEQFTNPPHARSQSTQPNETREHISRLSKQIATDFRDGLWTFFEDLRHATVGDEVRPLPSELPGLNSNPNTNKQDLQTRRNNRRASSPAHPTKLSNGAVGPLKIETLSTVKEHSAGTSPVPSQRNNDSENGRTDTKKKSPGGSRKSPAGADKNYKTPQKAAHHTRFYSIDEWGTWDSPSSRGTPAPHEQPRVSPQPSSRASRNPDLPRTPSYTPTPSLLNGPGDEVIYNSTILNGDHPHQIQGSFLADEPNKQHNGVVDDKTKVYKPAPSKHSSMISPTHKKLSIITPNSTEPLRSSNSHRNSSAIPRSSESHRSNTTQKRTPLFQASSSESLRSSKSGESKLSRQRTNDKHGDGKSPSSRSATRSAGLRKTASALIDEWEKTLSVSGSPTSTLIQEHSTPPLVNRSPSPRYRA